MKFTSSEYLSQKRLDNGNPTNTSNNYKPRVKIPNYTTPLHSTSKHHNVYKSSEGVITQPQRNLITPPSNSRNGTSMPRQPMNNNRMPSDPTRRTTPPSNDRLPDTPQIPNNRMPNGPSMPNNRMPNNRMPNTPNNRMPYNPNQYGNWDNYSRPEESNSMYSPHNSMYNHPVGVPIMPLYGYDNYEDAEKDWGYFRQLYPGIAKRILREIDEECDKLEYDGSCMFDEYPDRVHLGRMVDKIYNKIKDEIEEPIVYSESIEKTSSCDIDDHENDSEDNSINKVDSDKAKPISDDKDLETSEYRSGGRRDNRRDNRRGDRRPPVKSNNWLRDLIEILLYQEMINRRRRYRSRRRWF